MTPSVPFNLEPSPFNDPFNKKLKPELILFLILACLVHAVVFLMHFPWPHAISPPPIEIQQLDSQQLESIRKQWKQKSLLLNPDSSLPKEDKASPDARYLSDRNTRVEKEQKAKSNQVVPTPGRRPKANPQPKVQPKLKTKQPSLSRLAIPLNLDSTPAEASTPEEASSAQQASPQNIDDPNVPEGSQNILNTQESIYYSFYARLYEAIGPIWQSRTNEVMYRKRIHPGEYITIVDVVLDSNGNLQTVQKIRGSGVDAFDNAVYESWKKIERFPNPPQGLLNGEKQVHTSWRFKVQVREGLGLNYLPPERDE